MSIRGSVDSVTSKGIAGWAYASEKPEGVAVQAVLSHEVIGDAIATDHRPDLAAAGLGKGNCGYSIKFYRDIDPLYLPFVAVKVDGGDAELPRGVGGQLGFGEFFSGLYHAHPSLGRSRSVFGGLWTDRTDAAAILKARLEIGLIDAASALIVGQLIHDGIVIVERPSASAGVGSGDSSPADLASSLLEDTAILEALRAVFDDNPVVLSSRGVSGRQAAFVQPSAECASPSPAECVAIALTDADEGVTVEVVRDSHRLPEFTPGGVSRWTGAGAGLQLAEQFQGTVSTYRLSASSIAIIGAGTIYRVSCTDGAEAVKLGCAPSRTMPIALAK